MGSVASAASRAADMDVASLRAGLLRFYDERRRDLPWRRDVDPYGVWVSEIMLQQTRVETVIPYYERWMERFPDVETLACADSDDVMRAWEGLGYYSRARNLLLAARAVRERHAGVVPADPDSLRALPGIGEYTAGAIASIAFDRAEPAVDGNVRRVLSRLTDDPDPTHARLRALARRLVDPDRPGDFNQAMMELGATVCTPRAPACDACPVSSHCSARSRGTQALRPSPAPDRPVPTFQVATLVLTGADGRVLLERRPETGLLAGMWTFPGRVVQPGEAVSRAARRVLRDVIDRRSRARVDLADRVDHAFTHRRESYLVHRARLRAPARPLGRAAWFAPAALEGLALPRAQRRIARSVAAQEQGRKPG